MALTYTTSMIPNTTPGGYRTFQATSYNGFIYNFDSAIG